MRIEKQPEPISLRANSRSSVRTEVIILITPRLIRDPGEARALIASGAISLDDYAAKLRQEQAARERRSRNILLGVLVGIALLSTGAMVGLLSGGAPLRRALRQLAIGFGAAAARASYARLTPGG